MATKRDDAVNPLLAPSTRVTAAPKKTNKSLTNAKRKYTEETPGGLLIVREPRYGAQRQSIAASTSSKPPTKKFKADGLSVRQKPTRNPSVDPVVENDVREMDDEANNLPPDSMSFPPSSPVKPPRKVKSKSTDTEVPLLDGTPQAERNKALRGDTMTAITRDRGKTPEPDPNPRHRNSMGGRGKRISSSFQAGAFSLPHAKVHGESFYKHIDHDLPDSEQLRQLLTWSASRAAVSSVASSSPSSLPPEDVTAFKSIMDDMVKTLAESRLNLSLYRPDDEDAPTGTNTQNEKNKHREITYAQQLREAEEEAEGWKKTGHFYDTYTAKERQRIEERRQGHRNASPDEQLLDNERLRYGLRLSNAPSDANGLEAGIRSRLSDLPFKLDMLHTNLHAARTCARVTSRALDARFGLLNVGLGSLASRNRGESHINALAGPSGTGRPSALDATKGLLRVLASVDMERPLGKVGDAPTEAQRDAKVTLSMASTLCSPSGGPGPPRGESRLQGERTLGP
ncbi:Mis12-Mtw1 protein family-domain-containing protein [Favolaschia claudopus]|uniref:Mis12-Mtw1 protein family-domain-containing protein n=1 Tax=Favolaschia claudopus TaxID=2862362 RepID=A0AAV9ZY72_9AGAR